MVNLKQNFSFHATIAHPTLPDTLLNLNIQADAHTQTIALIGSLKKDSDWNFWISGQYFWQTDIFEGSIHGNSSFFQISTDVVFSQKTILNFSSIKSTVAKYTVEGNLEYNLKTQNLIASGNFLNRPFNLQTSFNISNDKLTASPLVLNYSDDQLKGGLAFSLKDHSLTGAIDLEMNDLTPFPIEHPIGGRARAHLSLTKNAINFSLDAKQIEWKDLYLPHMSMNGTWKENQIDFELNFQEFTVLDPDYEVFPNIHLQLKGHATTEHISVAGSVWGLGETPFYLSCNLPIHFSLAPLDITINQDAPFSLQVQGHGSIDPILAFLENASLIARGNIDMELAVTGTWKNPHLEGYLVYSDGWIESLTTGALFRGIHMEMEADGRELKIRSLSAHDVDKGDLSGNGSIFWSPNKGFPFEFHIFASRYLILALDPFTASVNAEITMAGTIHEMSISGKAIVVKAHLAIPNKMPVQVPTVEVSYINPIATPETEDKRKNDPYSMGYCYRCPARFNN